MQGELPEVRIAVPQDEAELMEMCKRLWTENGLFSFSEDKVRECLHKCYARQGNIVGVIGPSGRIEASTCLAISDFYYTTDWHLGELWNFVDESYRKSRNIEALIRFGIDCSDKMQIPLFTGIITNKQLAGKVRKYRQMLGHPVGAFFVHGSKWNTAVQEASAEDKHKELWDRITGFLAKYSDRSIPHAVVRDKLVPLMRDMKDLVRVAQDDQFPAVSLNGSAQSGKGI